jgi:hypothetical protein
VCSQFCAFKRVTSSGNWASASGVVARCGSPPGGLAVGEEERGFSSLMPFGKLESRVRREYKDLNLLEEARSKLRDGAYVVTWHHEDQPDLYRASK